MDEPFQAEMQDVAATVHAEYVRGEPKSIGRIAEKTEKENKNDISLLKDAVRCRFILVGDPTTDDVPVIEEVRRRYSIAQDETTGKEKIKRKYIAEDGTPLSIAGQSQYMDTKITVKVPDAVTGTDIFGEVVIATPEMAAATVAEHPLYEIIRSLNGTSSAEVTLRLKLETLSETFYESVSEQLGSTLQPGRNGES